MTHTKKELQAIYFGFYDQLPEPFRSEAKQNWQYEFAKNFNAPKTKDDAISYGFNWGEKGEWSKWNDFYDQLLRNEIPLTPDLTPSTPTLSDIKKQLDRIEVLLNKLIEKE